ncbi:MAG: Hsp20/alpha crystallin family protein [Candidatus Diapherotrites archaeon]
MERKRKPAKGLLDGLADFIRLIEEMEKKGLTEQVKRGDLEGPYGSKVKYEYRVRTGLGIRPGSMERFAGKPSEPFYRASKRMPTKVIKPEEMKEKEELAEVTEKKDTIEITVELPTVEEKDIDLKIVKNALKITVKRPEGKIEKMISIPKGSKAEKIEKASFKNGILEITLKKKIKKKNKKGVKPNG